MLCHHFIHHLSASFEVKRLPGLHAQLEDISTQLFLAAQWDPFYGEKHCSSLRQGAGASWPLSSSRLAQGERQPLNRCIYRFSDRIPNAWHLVLGRHRSKGAACELVDKLV